MFYSWCNGEPNNALISDQSRIQEGCMTLKKCNLNDVKCDSYNQYICEMSM